MWAFLLIHGAVGPEGGTPPGFLFFVFFFFLAVGAQHMWAFLLIHGAVGPEGGTPPGFLFVVFFFCCGFCFVCLGLCVCECGLLFGGLFWGKGPN